MKRLTLCVIFGGKSQEYYVSLRSAYTVLTNLSNEKYSIVKIGITRNGKWYIYSGENEQIPTDLWWKNEKYLTPVTVDLSSGQILMLDGTSRSITPHLVLPVMHGEAVEDGALQGMLEMAGIKYVGCDHFSSAFGMDKQITKLLASQIGIPVARGTIVDRNGVVASFYGSERLEKIIRDSLSERDIGTCVNGEEINCEKEEIPPVIIKPCRAGSSVGLSLAKTKKELRRGVKMALEYSKSALIEEYIEGFEVELAVLEYKGEILLSPIGRVIHKREVYDYEAKYQSSDNEYEIPAKADKGVEKSIKQYARALFRQMGCKGICRMDFFVTEGGAVLNEVNTLPGFTDISMYPMLFNHIGISTEQLIDIIVENELSRK